ncbi:MAG: LptF/LptG family permease [Spirochaetota bacterium]|nr:LptF/LptG family permease [Spirochaetota bacterium]
MKKLDTYLISQFLIAILTSLIIMMGLYIISICIDNLKYFSNPNVPLRFVAQYILNVLPGISVQVLPVAALFSCLFVFGNLNVNNETIAIYNGKIGFIRLIVPLLLMGLMLSILSFLFFEFVSVDSSYRAYEIRNKIKKLTGKHLNYMYTQSELFFLGEDKSFYYIEIIDSESGIMVKPVIFKFDKWNILSFQLYANIGQYDRQNNVWNFSDVVIIRFNKEGKFSEERKASHTMALNESPGSFLKTTKTFMQMRMADALKFIEAKKRAGDNYKEHIVEFHWRFAFPFSIIIVVLVGSIVGSYIHRAVLVLSFFLSIIISFVYYGILAVGLAFGKAGRLDPVMAAWLANLLCALTGIIALRIKR